MTLPPTPVPKRLLAYVLDILPFAVLASVLFTTFGRPAPGAPVPEWHHDGVKLWLVTLATMSLPVWLYFTLLESSRWQATLAKRVLSMRVVDLNGGRITFAQALLRTAVKLLPWEVAHATMFLPTPIGDAGEAGPLRWGFMASTLLTGSWLVTVLLTTDHTAVHDLIVKSRVVDGPSGPGSA